MQVLSFPSIKLLYWFLKMVKEMIPFLILSLSWISSSPWKLGQLIISHYTLNLVLKKRYECFKIVREYRERRESGHTEWRQTNPRVSPSKNWGIELILGTRGSSHWNICLGRRKREKRINSIHLRYSEQLLSAQTCVWPVLYWMLKKYLSTNQS